MSKNQEATLIVSAGGLLFGLGALLAHFSVQLFAFGFVWGSYLGFAALPFFNRHKWKPQPGICSFLAAALAAVACYFLEVSPSVSGLSVVIAALVGYFAPSWAPHM